MPVKMIVTDLDRTLLRSDNTVSEYTANIFNQCRENDIKIAFATARSEIACKRFIDCIKPDAVISNSGALVRKQGRIIHRATMSEDVVNRLLAECMKTQDIGYITVDTDKGFFVNKPVDENDSGWSEYLPVYHINFMDRLGCDAYKVILEIAKAEIAYDIADKIPEIRLTAFSGENWYMYSHKSACKWEGVLSFAKNVGVAADDIVCFGDDFSDIEMLKNSGIGVAVSNAIDEARAVANYICSDSDNDGVAKWIEENLLL